MRRGIGNIQARLRGCTCFSGSLLFAYKNCVSLVVEALDSRSSRYATDFHQDQREKTYLLKCAPNEDSNQPAHPHSLISLRFPHEETLPTWLAKTRLDRNVGMCRLI